MQFVHISTSILDIWLEIPNIIVALLNNMVLQTTTFTLIEVFIAKMRMMAGEPFVTVKVLIGVLGGYLNLVIIIVAILLCAWSLEPSVFQLNKVVINGSLSWNSLSSAANQIGYMMGGAFEIVNGQENNIIKPNSYRGRMLASIMYMGSNFYKVIAISMAINKLGKR